MTLYSPLPIVLMKPVEKIGRSKNTKFYKCPTYYYPIRDGTRENPSYLFEITLPINPELDEGFFIKRGTACLLNLSD
jgi:dynein heavy chain